MNKYMESLNNILSNIHDVSPKLLSEIRSTKEFTITKELIKKHIVLIDQIGILVTELYTIEGAEDLADKWQDIYTSLYNDMKETIQ